MPASLNFNTPDRIIRRAFKDSGLVQDGDNPNGEQYADAMNRLNDLVNLWQVKGVKLFLLAYINVTLIAGQSQYILGPGGSIVKPMQVLEGYYTDTNGLDRPLDLLSWNTYGALSNKTQTGVVTSFFPDRQALNTLVNLWLVPDTVAAAGTCKFLVRNQITNLGSIADTMIFPNEWYMALCWGLADELATGQPPAITQKCAQKAATYLQILEDWDVEDASVSFSPNMEGQYSAFR